MKGYFGDDSSFSTKRTPRLVYLAWYFVHTSSVKTTKSKIQPTNETNLKTFIMMAHILVILKIFNVAIQFSVCNKFTNRTSQPQSSHSWQFSRSSINNSQLFEFCYDKVTIVLTHRQVKATRMPMNECLNLNWLATINKTIFANNNRIQYWQLQKSNLCKPILLQIITNRTYLIDRKWRTSILKKMQVLFFLAHSFIFWVMDFSLLFGPDKSN